jgi:DNA-binding IclR family transcriptional regulator
MNVRDPIGNSFKVLRLLAEQAPLTLGVSEIARALEMQVSTTSRLLANLNDEGVVRRDREGGRYAIGLEILRLGRLASAGFDIGNIAEPYLQKLAKETGESVFLALYDHRLQKMVRIKNVPSKHPLQYLVELDVWTEVYRGASGLGILAFLPPDERKSVMRNALQEDPQTITTLGGVVELEELLGEIRTRGYAHTRGRRITGAVGFCAPLYDHECQVSGGVIVTLPESRFESGLEQKIAGRLIAAARHITLESGGQLPEGEATMLTDSDS